MSISHSLIVSFLLIVHSMYLLLGLCHSHDDSMRNNIEISLDNTLIRYSLDLPVSRPSHGGGSCCCRGIQQKGSFSAIVVGEHVTLRLYRIRVIDTFGCRAMSIGGKPPMDCQGWRWWWR
jgi:hypothetical protein